MEPMPENDFNEMRRLFTAGEQSERISSLFASEFEKAALTIVLKNYPSIMDKLDPQEIVRLGNILLRYSRSLAADISSLNSGTRNRQ
ncbi:MAG: hypothetical protein JJE25_09790 [Bacteroidia bacterium]|nr:hypothetical protein [Bacteroidia bacterium]